MSKVLLQLNVDVHDRQDHDPTMLSVTSKQAGWAARDGDANGPLVSLSPRQTPRKLRIA
jgi:hypothetical protein